MKNVLITGAYRGLGYEVALQLSQRGWRVILTVRRKDHGAAASGKLKNTSIILGIKPDTRYLCTEMAKQTEMIAWAYQRSIKRYEPEFIVTEWKVP
jgi:NAD(P)-dependent dehydrogenase (short-subunit alcohol dehydrogenase family)